ncbi:MAG: cytochrome c [Anaerohalosphaeraceae bacterium]
MMKTQSCLTLLLAAGLFAIVDCESKTKPATAVSAPPSVLMIPVLHITLGPVSTFEQSCARCHGPQGSFYGETFAKLSDTQLREFVMEMMEGPAGLHPTEEDIAAMTAYPRALSAGKPYLIVMDYAEENGYHLTGQASLQSNLLIDTAGGQVQAVPDSDGNWSVQLQSPPQSILVQKGDAQTLVDFRKP